MARPDVVARRERQHRHLARRLVDLDLGRLRAEGEVGEHLALPGLEVHDLAGRRLVDGEGRARTGGRGRRPRPAP